FFSSRRRHTRSKRDWSSDVCSSDLQGILAGTTQELLFRFAADQGIRAVARPVLEAELRNAEHVWLCSSVRLCAPVRAIDGRSLPIDTDLAEQFLGYARREG